MLDAEGRVLDGRNRLAACELASVKPQFTTYAGDDPDGYALAVNIARRHLTKGQRAMVAAKAVQFLDTGSVRKAAAENEVSKSRVSQACVVADHAPDLADTVVTGAVGLDEAYRIARERKQAAESTESAMVRLRGEAADLADQAAESGFAACRCRRCRYAFCRHFGEQYQPSERGGTKKVPQVAQERPRRRARLARRAAFTWSAR